MQNSSALPNQNYTSNVCNNDNIGNLQNIGFSFLGKNFNKSGIRKAEINEKQIIFNYLVKRKCQWQNDI